MNFRDRVDIVIEGFRSAEPRRDIRLRFVHCFWLPIMLLLGTSGAG